MRSSASQKKSAPAPASAPAADPARLEHLRATLLTQGSPSTVLTRLTKGDSREVRAACARRILNRALLLDVDRLHACALANLARCQQRFSRSADFERWLDDCIDEAVATLLREDVEEEFSGLLPCEPDDERYAFLSAGTAIDPTRARQAAVAFNQLSGRARKAYFALLIEQKSVDRCVADGMGTRKQIITDVRHALRSLLLPVRHDGLSMLDNGKLE